MAIWFCQVFVCARPDLLDMLSHVFQKARAVPTAVQRVQPQQTSIRTVVDGVPMVFSGPRCRARTAVTVMRMNPENATTTQVDFVKDLHFFQQQADVIDRCTMQMGGGVVLVGTVGSGRRPRRTPSCSACRPG
jgi:hypothetical protein